LKKIAISQNVDTDLIRGEVRNSVDVSWTERFLQTGVAAIPLPNQAVVAIELLKTLRPFGLVLTGGNNIGDYDSRERAETASVEWSVENEVSIFGVCRGMQFLNLYFGGSISRLDGHAGTSHLLVGSHFAEYPERVNSFHRFGIWPKDLADCLTAVAWGPDGSIEAFRHKFLRVGAVMWHPERDEPGGGNEGFKVVSDWFDLEE